MANTQMSWIKCLESRLKKVMIATKVKYVSKSDEVYLCCNTAATFYSK